MFGEACCTFIPNNTAPDGLVTKALEGLHTLSTEMHDYSGMRIPSTFGIWKTIIVSVSSSPYLVCCAFLLCVGVVVSRVTGPCATVSFVSAVVNPKTGFQMLLLGLTDQDEEAVVGQGYVD